MADHLSGPQIIEHISESVNYTPFETRWVPASGRFVGMGSFPKGTGALNVYQLDQGSLKVALQKETKDGIKCGTFNASLYEKRHLATGDLAGNLNVWDLEKPDLATFSVKAHDTIVNCIDGCGGLNVGYGAPELVTGSRDGCVKIWDPRQQDPVASLQPAKGQKPRDCWAVSFGNSYDNNNRCVAAGYDNGDIKLFDLRLNQVIWETNVKNGIVGLQFDRMDVEMNKLVVATLEARFRVYDMRTKHPEEGYASLVEKAHKSTIWMGRHLPQNRDVFMTCGGNGTLNLYKYKYPSSRVQKDPQTSHSRGVMGELELLNSKRFSDQPIVSFDWHVDKKGLAVCTSLDQTIRVLLTTKL